MKPVVLQQASAIDANKVATASNNSTTEFAWFICTNILRGISITSSQSNDGKATFSEHII